MKYTRKDLFALLLIWIVVLAIIGYRYVGIAAVAAWHWLDIASAGGNIAAMPIEAAVGVIVGRWLWIRLKALLARHHDALTARLAQHHEIVLSHVDAKLAAHHEDLKASLAEHHDRMKSLVTGKPIPPPPGEQLESD